MISSQSAIPVMSAYPPKSGRESWDPLRRFPDQTVLAFLKGLVEQSDGEIFLHEATNYGKTERAAIAAGILSRTRGQVTEEGAVLYRHLRLADMAPRKGVEFSLVSAVMPLFFPYACRVRVREYNKLKILNGRVGFVVECALHELYVRLEAPSPRAKPRFVYFAPRNLERLEALL